MYYIKIILVEWATYKVISIKIKHIPDTQKVKVSSTSEYEI